MEMKRGNILLDARKPFESESAIKKNIVSGVLSQTGLPKIANIIPGAGQPLNKGREQVKSTPELLTVPREDRSVTKFMPGNLAYADTQHKKRY